MVSIHTGSMIICSAKQILRNSWGFFLFVFSKQFGRAAFIVPLGPENVHLLPKCSG